MMTTQMPKNARESSTCTAGTSAGDSVKNNSLSGERWMIPLQTTVMWMALTALMMQMKMSSKEIVISWMIMWLSAAVNVVSSNKF